MLMLLPYCTVATYLRISDKTPQVAGVRNVRDVKAWEPP
jgi:hypothetical protein